jgi:hypothetical protein
MRALTREIKDTHSPVRQFLDERFTGGLRDLQRRFRHAAPPVAVPPVPQAEANPGTLGTAADWLLRFLVCPRPDVHLAMTGAASLGPWLADLAGEVVQLLGTGPSPEGWAAFTGPVAGSTVDEELLARGCWVLALATEMFRSSQAAAIGPLAQVCAGKVTADDLLALAPPAGLRQLAAFRRVFEATLVPALAARPGPWALGPTFAGSSLIGGADGDLIAAGLLVDLKTTVKLSLPVADVLQLIGYTLLDFDDEYALTELGIFSARYAHLVTWPLSSLLDELAGHQVSLQATRDEFRRLLPRGTGKQLPIAG